MSLFHLGKKSSILSQKSGVDDPPHSPLLERMGGFLVAAAIKLNRGRIEGRMFHTFPNTLCRNRLPIRCIELHFLKHIIYLLGDFPKFSIYFHPSYNLRYILK